MERQKEQEIRDYLDKIGLKYSDIVYDNGYYIQSIFKIRTATKCNFKQNLTQGLKDIIQLAEDYIRKIDEN